MSLHAEEIGLVVELLDRAMRGAVVREILSEKKKDRIVIVFRGFGENHHLRICVDAAFCRMARISDRPACSEVPHPFVMLLRKVLTGRRLDKIETVGKDRVVRLVFQSFAGQCALLCELTSRHANIFLLNEDRRIAGSFFPNRSELRKLVPGELYVAPFFHAVAESANRFEGAPCLEQAVEAYYQKKEADSEAEVLRAAALRKIAVDRKKAEKLLGALALDLEKAKQGERFGLYGQVLKAALSDVKKGRLQFIGVDFDGREVVVPLNPKLRPVENMNRLFDKARRLNRAVAPIEARMAGVASTIEVLKCREKEIETADIETLLSSAVAWNSDRKPGDTQKTFGSRGRPERLPYREFTIFSGRPARVGRTARDNDVLTLRHAKPDDLWLHVRNAPGSHVVVPMGRKEDPHPRLLIDAAHLAAYFSSLKGQPDVEVLYTRRRYVQKQKGASPGTVRLLKEKSIALRVEEDRIQKILHGESVYSDSPQT